MVNCVHKDMRSALIREFSFLSRNVIFCYRGLLLAEVLKLNNFFISHFSKFLQKMLQRVGRRSRRHRAYWALLMNAGPEQ